MTAINYVPIFQRDFSRDFDSVSEDSIWNRCQSVGIAAFPLLTLNRACRIPVSAILSGTRGLCQGKTFFETMEKSEWTQATYQFFHLFLTTTAFGLLFFQPAFSYAATSFSDLLNRFSEMQSSFSEEDLWRFGDVFAHAMLDGLFLATIFYGAVEITVACAALQICLELCLSVKHFRNQKYMEGFCQGILAAAHLKPFIPQYQLLKWKYQTNPVFEGVLKRSKQGFVYLDIPDEQVFSLLEYCKNHQIKLPPYFKPGMAGAHISVATVQEKTGEIPELGQKFSFRISHMDFFDQGNKRVHIVAVVCPALESIRMNQGLSARIHDDHDFHFTYGVTSH